MKLKTFFVTKKTIAVFLVSVMIITGLCIFRKNIKTAAKTTFVVSEEDILSEGLPKEMQEINVGETVKGFLGLEPKEIMAQYLNISSDVEDVPNTTVTPIVESTAVPQDEMSKETEVPNSISLPSKEQICVAENLKLSNATSYSVDINSICAQELVFRVEVNSEPQVLVVHTHSTECYDGDAMQSDSERNTDEQKNVIAVGEAICDVLREHGIESVHDKTVHDYPTYQGAYTRTLKTIENNLQAYPSIKVVLDVHRDAFVYNDGSKLRVAADINGLPTAQVMIVVGTDSMGLYHPNWRENLKLAAKMQNAANIMYPGLMRSIDLRTERFNMHMTTGSLLLEVGSNGNTLNEAIEGGRAAAHALAAVLLAG